MPPKRQVAVFLTVVGASNYALLNDFCAPDKPKDKSLEELIVMLKSHFNPEPIVISERYYFHKRDQRPTESISDFVADFRCLPINCKFVDHLQLEESL